MYRIVTAAIDAQAVAAAVTHPRAGAVVTFVGTTRDHNEGRRVLRLEYEAYEDMALSEMRKLGEAAAEQWPIEKVAVVHRVGVVPVGEASVVIAVSSAHRDAAFEACRFLIDRLKNWSRSGRRSFTKVANVDRCLQPSLLPGLRLRLMLGLEMRRRGWKRGRAPEDQSEAELPDKPTNVLPRYSAEGAIPNMRRNVRVRCAESENPAA